MMMNLISSVAVFAAIVKGTGNVVYMAGDSTMAPGGGGNGTNGRRDPLCIKAQGRMRQPHFKQKKGWGQYLEQYLTIPVVNDAIAGRSARSYTEEGHFAAITQIASPGDFVVIEFGHNDGTASPDNGRQDAVGDGYNTTAIVQTAK